MMKCNRLMKQHNQTNVYLQFEIMLDTCECVNFWRKHVHGQSLYVTSFSGTRHLQVEQQEARLVQQRYSVMLGLR